MDITFGSLIHLLISILDCSYFWTLVNVSVNIHVQICVDLLFKYVYCLSMKCPPKALFLEVVKLQQVEPRWRK
jgi:hypothetical protein